MASNIINRNDEKLVIDSVANSVVITHSGTPKLETSASGITVTGEVAATSFVGDGSGLTNVPGGGGGGGYTRSSKVGTTATLADDAAEDLDIVGAKSYFVLEIQTDEAAWVRLYTDAASRTGDASRDISTDPQPGDGVIAEVVTAGAETVVISPGAIGFNNEATPTTTIPCRVTNKSGSSAAIQVTLKILQLEA